MPDEADSPPAVPADPPKEKRFPCAQCGARLVYTPGTQSQTCEYCGHANAIPQSQADIVEVDFRAKLAELAAAEPTGQISELTCEACAAKVQKPANVEAFACPFCGTDIVTTAISVKHIKPRSLLPFHIDRKAARQSFRDWIRSLWFAPGKLKKFAQIDDRLNGMYVPYWTYDCDTTTFYTGKRGDDYYVTKTRRVRRGDKWVTETYQERRTRWTSVSGTVWNSFDDILVIASHSLPHRYVEKLEPWDLGSLTPYADEYLSGFQAESYTVELHQGFGAACKIMDEHIRSSIRSDIGGDHQRIHAMNVQRDHITFKHILLPIWICAYRYGRHTYRFLINGRTGEVQGERPWSWWKISFTVLAAAVLLGGVIALFAAGR